jgi:hypothetical protein
MSVGVSGLLSLRPLIDTRCTNGLFSKLHVSSACSVIFVLTFVIHSREAK